MLKRRRGSLTTTTTTTTTPPHRTTKENHEKEAVTLSPKAALPLQKPMMIRGEQTCRVFLETSHDNNNNKTTTTTRITNTTTTTSHDLVVVPKSFPRDMMIRDMDSNESTAVVGDESTQEIISILKTMWNRVVESKKGSSSGGTSSATLTNQTNTCWTPTPIQLQTWSTMSSQSSSNLNVIGIGPTGSGKTLAYGMAMIASIVLSCGTNNDNKNSSNKNVNGIHGICLVPTRELAKQVESDLKLPCRALLSMKNKKNRLKVQLACIYGGRGDVDRDDQIQTLHKAKHGPMIVIATPGRFLDILQERSDIRQLCTTTLKFLILDEADRFAMDRDMCQQIDDIRTILPTNNIRTCLFSATKKKSVSTKWNDWVQTPRVIIQVDTLTVGGKQKASTTSSPTAETCTEKSLNDQTKSKHETTTAGEGKRRKLQSQGCSSIGGGGGGGGVAVDMARIPAHVVQTLMVCLEQDKPRQLLATIAKIRHAQTHQRNKTRTVVFFARIKTLQSVHKFLLREGHAPKGTNQSHKSSSCYTEYHAKLSQGLREQALKNFRSGKCTIMLATDIAARGMHVDNLEYVVNYDFPDAIEQYVHRCGRAGRSQTKEGRPTNGTVYSFFTPESGPIMANSVVEILQATKSCIDPKLLQMTGVVVVSERPASTKAS